MGTGCEAHAAQGQTGWCETKTRCEDRTLYNAPPGVFFESNQCGIKDGWGCCTFTSRNAFDMGNSIKFCTTHVLVFYISLRICYKDRVGHPKPNRLVCT